MEQSTEVTNEVIKKGFSLTEFARDTRREIQKVTWPSRRETVQTTVIIIVAALIAGVVFLVIDSILGFAISRILGMNS